MQNDVSIATNEKDLRVTYGMINFHPEREQARTSLKYLLTDVNDIRRSYIRLGFHLHEFDRNKFYEDFGYSSLSEFCEVNLGLDKSAVSRCISVFLEFAKVNDCMTRTRTMFLDDKYEAFSYSQLCEMVSMTSEQRKLVKPEMTIKQLREIKKKKNVSRNVSQVATSQPEEVILHYPSFLDDIFISDLLYQCKKFVLSSSLPVMDAIISGKRFSFKDSKGNLYTVQYSVMKNKNKEEQV